MLARIDGLDADLAAVDEQIGEQLAPFAAAAARLDEIPGIGPIAAAAILVEVGTDMSRFPTAGHLCSWAKFSPGIKSSAGKTKGSGSTGHGNRYLARVLGERCRRLAWRRSKLRAVVAMGRSILVIVWQLLADPGAAFRDLGPDHFSRRADPEAAKRAHVRQLEALDYTVTLTPAA
ncbi:transposase [Arthrobacter mobilis]|uniref:transposase n=1 Tax=Arthrobacter mobilis TaxID=2724944 RepID=UPI001FEB52CA|nr:transposase [Arthrobacter mobilis]